MTVARRRRRAKSSVEDPRHCDDNDAQHPSFTPASATASIHAVTIIRAHARVARGRTKGHKPESCPRPREEAKETLPCHASPAMDNDNDHDHDNGNGNGNADVHAHAHAHADAIPGATLLLPQRRIHTSQAERSVKRRLAVLDAAPSGPAHSDAQPQAKRLLRTLTVATVPPQELQTYSSTAPAW